MKKLLLAFLFVPLLTYAQTKIEGSKPVNCYTIDYIKEQVGQAGESLIIFSGNKMTKDSMIGIFYNEDTGTWTAVEFTKKLGCVLGYGIDKKIKI